MPRSVSVEELLARGPMDEDPELRLLFHRLNNQLGIILAHAELLESKAADDMSRSRAAQVVATGMPINRANSRASDSAPARWMPQPYSRVGSPIYALTLWTPKPCSTNWWHCTCVTLDAAEHSVTLFAWRSPQ